VSSFSGGYSAFPERISPALPMADHALLGSRQTHELFATNRVLSGQESIPRQTSEMRLVIALGLFVRFYINAQCRFWVLHQATNLAKWGTLPLPIVLLHAPLSQLGK
jgi:hypothetical protein